VAAFDVSSDGLLASAVRDSKVTFSKPRCLGKTKPFLVCIVSYKLSLVKNWQVGFLKFQEIVA
jgi:hypothetical protein